LIKGCLEAKEGTLAGGGAGELLVVCGNLGGARGPKSTKIVAENSHTCYCW